MANNKSKQYPKDSRHKEKQMKISRNIGASPYQVNSQMLSADRLMQQNSFRIETENFFKVEPFLHFF